MKILVNYDCGHSVEFDRGNTFLVEHKKIGRKHYELWTDLKEDFKKCIHCKIAESEAGKC